MTDDRGRDDRKALSKLVRRQGLAWVLENSKQIDTEPASTVGRPPHYRFNIASVWACVEFRRKTRSETIVKACEELHAVMSKHVVGFKLKSGRLKGMYHDAAKNRQRDPALAGMMAVGLKGLRSQSVAVKKIAKEYVFFPVFFEAHEELPAKVMIAILYNLKKPPDASALN